MVKKGEGQSKIEKATTSQARGFLLLLCLLLSLATLLSLYLNLRSINEKYRTLAAESGRSFFQAIDTLREWNLDHGGIYAQEGPDIPPNPYLPESLRAAMTTDGRTLNMINHAQMTRLFSELLTRQSGIHLHISSLAPIRPGNFADAWEQHALAHFRDGSREEFDVVGEGGNAVFRYMAPLRLEDRCLSCHPGQAESQAQTRGGISVSFSYAPFEAAISVERKRNIILHVIFFCLGIGLITLTGRKIVLSIAALQDSLLRIKRLEGFLPICAQCKKIRLRGADRHDEKSWIAIEQYIAERTDAEFTHGLCPQCARELYPTLFNNPVQ
jgi:hypothetical protein